MQTVSSSTPSVLSRFPSEVQSAYSRFDKDRNEADLNIIVHAALRDFIPKNKSRELSANLVGQMALIDDLGLDSLAVAEMIFFFEDLFQVSIPSAEIMKLRTVADLEGYVKQKLSEKKSSA